mmetsp:Transcript_27852/g.80781  ORF Transcript_27852/g.80781 Transcript_27852/m.80781 type:complete len:375 (-) Transcript_27852:1456-2580(-)
MLRVHRPGLLKQLLRGPWHLVLRDSPRRAVQGFFSALSESLDGVVRAVPLDADSLSVLRLHVRVGALPVGLRGAIEHAGWADLQTHNARAVVAARARNQRCRADVGDARSGLAFEGVKHLHPLRGSSRHADSRVRNAGSRKSAHEARAHAGARARPYEAHRVGDGPSPVEGFHLSFAGLGDRSLEGCHRNRIGGGHRSLEHGHRRSAGRGDPALESARGDIFQSARLPARRQLHDLVLLLPRLHVRIRIGMRIRIRHRRRLDLCIGCRSTGCRRIGCWRGAGGGSLCGQEGRRLRWHRGRRLCRHGSGGLREPKGGRLRRSVVGHDLPRGGHDLGDLLRRKYRLVPRRRRWYTQEEAFGRRIVFGNAGKLELQS